MGEEEDDDQDEGHEEEEVEGGGALWVGGVGRVEKGAEVLGGHEDVERQEGVEEIVEVQVGDGGGVVVGFGEEDETEEGEES